jgi:hypothetical protein
MNRRRELNLVNLKKDGDAISVLYRYPSERELLLCPSLYRMHVYKFPKFIQGLEKPIDKIVVRPPDYKHDPFQKDRDSEGKPVQYTTIQQNTADLENPFEDELTIRTVVRKRIYPFESGETEYIEYEGEKNETIVVIIADDPRWDAVRRNADDNRAVNTLSVCKDTKLYAYNESSKVLRSGPTKYRINRSDYSDDQAFLNEVEIRRNKQFRDEVEERFDALKQRTQSIWEDLAEEEARKLSISDSDPRKDIILREEKVRVVRELKRAYDAEGKDAASKVRIVEQLEQEWIRQGKNFRTKEDSDQTPQVAQAAQAPRPPKKLVGRMEQKEYERRWREVMNDPDEGREWKQSNGYNKYSPPAGSKQRVYEWNRNLEGDKDFPQELVGFFTDAGYHAVWKEYFGLASKPPKFDSRNFLWNMDRKGDADFPQELVGTMSMVEYERRWEESTNDFNNKYRVKGNRPSKPGEAVIFWNREKDDARDSEGHLDAGFSATLIGNMTRKEYDRRWIEWQKTQPVDNRYKTGERRFKLVTHYSWNDDRKYNADFPQELVGRASIETYETKWQKNAAKNPGDDGYNYRVKGDAPKPGEAVVFWHHDQDWRRDNEGKLLDDTFPEDLVGNMTRREYKKRWKELNPQARDQEIADMLERVGTDPPYKPEPMIYIEIDGTVDESTKAFKQFEKTHDDNMRRYRQTIEAFQNELEQIKKETAEELEEIENDAADDDADAEAKRKKIRDQETKRKELLLRKQDVLQKLVEENKLWESDKMQKIRQQINKKIAEKRAYVDNNYEWVKNPNFNRFSRSPGNSKLVETKQSTNVDKVPVYEHGLPELTSPLWDDAPKLVLFLNAERPTYNLGFVSIESASPQEFEEYVDRLADAMQMRLDLKLVELPKLQKTWATILAGLIGLRKKEEMKNDGKLKAEYADFVCEFIIARTSRGSVAMSTATDESSGNRRDARDVDTFIENLHTLCKIAVGAQIYNVVLIRLYHYFSDQLDPSDPRWSNSGEFLSFFEEQLTRREIPTRFVDNCYKSLVSFFKTMIRGIPDGGRRKLVKGAFKEFEKNFKDRLEVLINPAYRHKATRGDFDEPDNDPEQDMDADEGADEGAESVDEDAELTDVEMSDDEEGMDTDKGYFVSVFK